MRAIGLHSGLSASADVILIPEVEYEFEPIIKKIKDREASGRMYTIVVVAEGAVEKGETHFVKGKTIGQAEQLGGADEYIAKTLSERTGKESRSIVLGHLQRGGTPSTYDRLISLRFGAAAIRAIAQQDFNKLIVMQKNCITRIPISDVANKMKLVPLDGDTVQTARDIGICMGD